MRLISVRHSVVAAAVLATGLVASTSAQSDNRPPQTSPSTRSSTALAEQPLSATTQAGPKVFDTSSSQAGATDTAPNADERQAEAKRRADAALANENRTVTMEETPAPASDIAAMAQDAELLDQKPTAAKTANSDKSVCIAGCN